MIWCVVIGFLVVGLVVVIGVVLDVGGCLGFRIVLKFVLVWLSCWVSLVLLVFSRLGLFFFFEIDFFLLIV